jgi:integrase/recombinase XerD
MGKRSLPEDLPLAIYRWLILRGSKKSTARCHKNSLKFFLSRGGDPSSVESVNNYILSLKERNYSSSHVNNFVGAIRVFTRYLEESNIKFDASLKDTKFFKDKYRMKATMSDDEIEAFLALEAPVSISKTVNGKMREWSNVKPENYNKWTLFFKIMAFTGMRPGEVAKLTVNNIDFGRKIFIVEDSKTNEPRYVPIAPNLETDLKEHLSSLKQDKLFPSKREDGVVSSTEWHYNFHTRIKRLGIVRPNLTPYSLRHSLITRLLEEDVNIFKVQKIVGHKDLRTTAHYTHLTTKDIMAAISKHPIVMRSTDPENILDQLQEFMEKLNVSKDNRFLYSLKRSKGKLGIKIEVARQKP